VSDEPEERGEHAEPAESQEPARRSNVRPAGLRDLDRVAALWTAITDHHRALDPLFRMRPGAGDELGRMLQAMYRDPDAAIFVYDEGDLPGMCIVRIDRAPPILEEVERAEITDLGVRPQARRRGIGHVLVDAALAWVRAAGVGRVEIQVARGNPEGQAFWRAQGFDPLMDVLHKRL
jgi:GNAT superfamily N-acetyltransferase